MERLKILQLCSFEGNIGDVFITLPYPQLASEALQADVHITRAHMRDFYKNSQKRHFDTAFLREINDHDMFVIGGGLYFDVRWDYSHTGTTLNFSDEFIEGIKVPVVLNGLGYAEPSNIEESDAARKQIFAKFERFIRNVSKRRNWFLSVRNDGSFERIAARFGQNFAALIQEIPDCGFFFDKDVAPYVFDEQRCTVGFSIGNDTFTPDETTAAMVRQLNDGVARAVQSLVSQGIRVIFFLHMPRDIDAVYQIMQLVGVEGFRKHVVIAPYNPSGITAAQAIVSYYKACDAVVAMRFHANVLALQNTIPSIGLVAKGIVSGERITALYKKMKMDHYTLQTDEADSQFAERLMDMIAHILSHCEDCIELEAQAMTRIMQQRNDYCNALREFYDAALETI